MDLNSSTICVLKGLEIGSSGCSKRPVSSQLLLRWSPQAEG